MIDTFERLEPATARKLFLWQMAFFGALLALSNVVNALSSNTDYARVGIPLEPWKPFVWEFSSGFMLWLLVPVLHLWLTLFPITRPGWWRSLPAHLLMTVPFSLVHVGGMVQLRELVYHLLGDTYEFGPWWPNWRYELNKDFFSYWVIVALLMAFRIYGMWLDSRAAAAAPAAEDATPDDPPLERLVVRKLNREFILNVADIDRIDADGNYVALHARGTVYALRESLLTLEKKLDRQRFARVHRRHMVNIDSIREIQPWDHGDYRIMLKDGSFINFSRRYRRRLNHLFG